MAPGHCGRLIQSAEHITSIQLCTIRLRDRHNLQQIDRTGQSSGQIITSADREMVTERLKKGIYYFSSGHLISLLGERPSVRLSIPWCLGSPFNGAVGVGREGPFDIGVRFRGWRGKGVGCREGEPG